MSPALLPIYSFAYFKKACFIEINQQTAPC